VSPSAFRINVRVFNVFLIVGLVMLAIASAFVLGIGQGQLRTAYGEHLGQVADEAAAAIDAYVYRRIIDASILARVPDVRQEAADGSRRPFDLEAVRQIDQEWQRTRTAPVSVRGLFDTRASAFLVDVSQQEPIYRELLLTDRQGRLIAASRTTSNYYQAEEDWWRDAFGGGVSGRLTVTDVRWDESSRVYALEIVAPVADPSGSDLVGILKIVADVRELGTVLGGVRLGNTGEASLLRDDGSFVFSLRTLDPKARFFATDLLRERLQATQQAQPQGHISFSATSTDGTSRLVGAAQSQLRASYPQLAWVVAVSQDDSELFLPIRAQFISLLLVLALTAVAVLLFALWLSTRLAALPPDTDLHLVTHQRVHRIEEPDEEAPVS
jgi:hypothetical protein